ncbi:hypothetical protein D5278_19220 [bacterium 1XD21-13]|nr:hypothetical protein [bacterium 1XD21-13]
MLAFLSPPVISGWHAAGPVRLLVPSIGFIAHESLRIRAHWIIIVIKVLAVKDFFKENQEIRCLPYK